MKLHKQISDRSRVWFDLVVVDNGDGTLSIPAGSCWVHGFQYALSTYSPNLGSSQFRLWVEQTEGGADYLLDLTMEALPQSFGEGIGAILVAWKDAPADQVHVLRSIA